MLFAVMLQHEKRLIATLNQYPIGRLGYEFNVNELWA